MLVTPRWRGIVAAAIGDAFAPIAGLGHLDLYTDFRTGSLTGAKGGTWSLTRATATTGVDHEGLVRNILAGEARFRGLRRVENRATTEDFSNAAWTKTASTITTGVSDPVGGTSAYTLTSTGAGGFMRIQPTATIGDSFRNSMWVRRRTGTGTVNMYTGASASAVAGIQTIITSSWQRIATNAVTNTDGTSSIGFVLVTSGDAIDIWHPQQEIVSGQAITAPSEYVSKGVLSAPYHGAGVDGVKYFTTANGNTVASNVVTEAAGAALSVTTAGLSVFGAATNILLHNRDGTNAAWVKGATMTAAKTATGADGTANGATTYTGGAVTATNTVLQTVVSASAARYATAWIRRRTGTGTIEMTTDGGTSWIDVTSQISSTYAQVTIPVQTVTNPVTGFRITTNLDAIDVDYVMNTGVAAAPAIATTTAAVTVNADVVTLSGAGIINATEGTPYVQAIGPTDVSVNRQMLNLDDGTSTERILMFLEATSRKANYLVTDGGATQVNQLSTAATSAGTAFKHAARYRLNDSNQALDGVANTADTTCTMPTTTTFRLGNVTAGFEPNTVVQVVAYSRTGATDANLAVATTP